MFRTTPISENIVIIQVIIALLYCLYNLHTFLLLHLHTWDQAPYHNRYDLFSRKLLRLSRNREIDQGQYYYFLNCLLFLQSITPLASLLDVVLNCEACLFPTLLFVSYHLNNCSFQTIHRNMVHTFFDILLAIKPIAVSSTLLLPTNVFHYHKILIFASFLQG